MDGWTMQTITMAGPHIVVGQLIIITSKVNTSQGSQCSALFASFWPIFGGFFLKILLQLKNFFQKSKCVHHPCIRCHRCPKFDILRPS